MNRTNDTKAEQPLLLVDLSEGYGGVDVHILDLARGLHGQRAYGVATIEGSPLHTQLVAAALHVELVPHAKRDPRNLLALWQIIRRGGYQLVDAHNEQSWLWGLGAARLARVPGLVATVHLPWQVIPGGTKGLLQGLLLRVCYRWGCSFVTVSHSIADQLHAIGVSREDIAVIYNAVEIDSNAGATASAASAAICKMTGWPPESYVLVVVGRLSRQKGHHFLLEAMAQLKRHYPQVRCLIVGDGTLQSNLEAQVTTLGLNDVVHFTGFCPDVSQLLPGCDLFCLPSYAEGLPYAALEATQFRLPLLLSAVDGIRELFAHKETAYLTPVGDVAAIAEGIAWSIEHPTDTHAMGEAAHAFVSTHLTMANMLTAKEQIYERVGSPDRLSKQVEEQSSQT